MLFSDKMNEKKFRGAIVILRSAGFGDIVREIDDLLYELEDVREKVLSAYAEEEVDPHEFYKDMLDIFL